MGHDIYPVIIESMSDGVLVIDFQGYITHINSAASRILDIQKEDTKDKTYAQLFMSESENDEFNDILFKGIQDGEARLYGEVPFKRKDGGFLDLAVTTSFLRSDSGQDKKTGIVVVFKDITEFKALDRAREKILDHLSHELKTPLAIIIGSLKRFESPENEKTLERIRRNMKRLEDIQFEVEDIVTRKSFKERYPILPWAKQTLDFLELLGDDDKTQADSMDYIKTRVEEFFSIRESKTEEVNVKEIVKRTIANAKELSSFREVNLQAKTPGSSIINIAPDVLEKALMGLIKNAVENTPDGGEVSISLKEEKGQVIIEVKDPGVGIIKESQKQIFGGFYHAKDTDLYSTKKPFDFNAGGKGLDLLRIKVFGELYGFKAECSSVRCQFIPGEDDLCPGSIEQCDNVKNKDKCALSGGTSFKLIFNSK